MSVIILFLAIFFAWSIVYVLPKQIPFRCEYYGEMNPINEFTGNKIAFYKVIFAEIS